MSTGRAIRFVCELLQANQLLQIGIFPNYCVCPLIIMCNTLLRRNYLAAFFVKWEVLFDIVEGTIILESNGSVTTGLMAVCVDFYR